MEVQSASHWRLQLQKGIDYRYYPICEEVPHKLSWTYFCKLVKIDDLVKHFFVGQMNMYLGYFEKEENTTGDNPPIGMVLAREKDDILISYALHGITTQRFVSKYQLYLPNEEELRAELEHILRLKEGK